MEKEKDNKNIEMQNLADSQKADDKVNIEDIIREKNIKKELNIQKEAHKAASAFGTGHGIVDAIYNGLISMLDATSKVLNRAGSSIPIAGFIFQLLGTVVGVITAVLDPKASTGAKIAALAIAAVTIALMVTAFATAGTVAALGIGFVALGIGVVAESAKLLSSIKNYWDLRKERNVSRDFNEIIKLELEKKNNPKMDQVELDKINKRIEKLENRIGPEKLLEKLKITQLVRKDNLEKKIARGELEKAPDWYKDKKNYREYQNNITDIIDNKIKGQENLKNKKLESLEQQRNKITNKMDKGVKPSRRELNALVKIDSEISKIKGGKNLDQLLQERKEMVERHETSVKQYLDAPDKAKFHLGSHLRDLQELNKKELAEVDQKIAAIITPEEKLKQLYQERKEVMNNYVKDMKVFESYPPEQAKVVAEGVQNLAKVHRKAIMEIDKQIEEIAKPPGYLQGQISLAKKAIVDSATGFVAAVGGLVGTVLATVGFPPAGIAIAAGVGVIGVGKAVVGTAVEHQDKKAEKALNQQKKSEVREEVVGEYRKQSSYAQLATAGIMSTKAPESMVTPPPPPPPKPEPTRSAIPPDLPVVKDSPGEDKSVVEAPTFRR